MEAKFDYVVSTVVDVDDKSRWTRCGVGFKNKDSITILMDVVPLNGKLVLTKPDPLPDKKKEHVENRSFL